MAVIMTIEVPGATSDQYDRADAILLASSNDRAPDGLVSHACGLTDDGLLVVDVWESEGQLGRFHEDQLGPAWREAGFPEAQPRVLKLHNIIPQGSGTEANVIVMTELDAGPEAYDAIVDTLDAHLTSGEHHPCVSHVAGITEDGKVFVTDLWDSAEAFGQFAETQLKPAVGDSMGEVVPRFVPVHNFVRGRATVSA